MCRGAIRFSGIPIPVDSVAAKAEEWLDVPFAWQGSVRAGCDCKGLLAGVARELGRPEADSLEALAGDYGARVPTQRLRAGLERLFDRVAPEARKPGDVLLCKLGGAAQHLAIYCPTDTRPNRAIEAMPSGPGRVRPGQWPLWRIDSVWRWRETGSD